MAGGPITPPGPTTVLMDRKDLNKKTLLTFLDIKTYSVAVMPILNELQRKNRSITIKFFFSFHMTMKVSEIMAHIRRKVGFR